ncbi:hypothetical protein BH24ACT1_BH24ACT1_11320 [soil metagenome]
MDVISYVRILGGRWRIVALTCFIGLVAGWITTPGAGDASATVGFSATHILRTDAGGAEAEADRSRGQVGPNVGVTAFLATTGEVPTRAAAELNTDVTGLLTRVRAVGDSDLGTLSITAIDAEAGRAAEIADTFARVLLEVLAEDAQERYAAELEEARAALADLQAQVDALPPLAASGRADVESAARAPLVERFANAGMRVQELEAQGPPSAGFVTLQEAIPQVAGAGGAAARPSTRQPESGRRAQSAQDSQPVTPAVPAQNLDSAPERTTRMLIGGAVGLLLGIGLALLRERLDPRIRTREDAERAFRLPVLAEIPHLDRHQRRQPQIATVHNGRALEAESYRVLATSMLFQRSSRDGGDTPGIGDGLRDGDRPTTANASVRPFEADSDPPGLIESSEDVRRATNGLRLLGRVPAPARWDALAHRGQPNSPSVEDERWLGIPLGRADQDGPTRTLLVTSATAGEETTATAANLGVAMARDGQRVVVIDGDIHQPLLHTFFDLPNTVGLTSVVEGEVSLSVATKPVAGEEGLSIVAAGPLPPDPQELLTSPRIGEVLGALAGTADVVILKVAPVLSAGGAFALADQVDGTLLVADSGTTSGLHLRGAVDLLERVGASLLGVVLTEPAQDGRLSTSESHSLPDMKSQVVLVTSPGAQEGKSSASVNLAAALAEAGKSVVALDFDLRRPRLHEFFDEDRHQRGLTDALALSGRRLILEEIVRRTSVPDVRVVLSGSAVVNPSELLPGARQLIGMARDMAEVVLIDTPPVLVASDAVQLIPAADVVVIACRTGRTRAAEAARARQLLARLDAPVLGLVLLGMQPSSGARSYYYDRASRPSWWSRTRGRQEKAGPPPRRDEVPRPVDAADDNATDKATDKATAKVDEVPAEKAESTKATKARHKARRGKKAKQRSTST